MTHIRNILGVLQHFVLQFSPILAFCDRRANPLLMKLEDRLRDKIRLKQMSLRTEEVYVQWYRRFVRRHGKRHPADMGAEEIEQLLTFLAAEKNVAPSTQNQALNALMFLYREVVGRVVSGSLSADPRANTVRRHHLQPMTVNRAIARVTRARWWEASASTGPLKVWWTSKAGGRG